MAYIGSPPADRVLSSADIAQGAVTLNDINFTDVPTNMDITGTIDKHTMRLAEGVTITGDVTISEDLVLAKISDDGDAITMTSDGSSRTITGSGSIQAATLAATPQPTTVLASTSIASDAIRSTHIADNQVTLAKMAGGADGQIITYDDSGDPVAVGPGTDGQVLTSTGAGSSPAFEDIPAVTMPAGSCLKVSSYPFGTAYSTSSMSWQNAGSSVTHQVTNAGCALLVFINNMSLALLASGYTGSNVYVRLRILVDGTAYNRLQGAIKNGSGSSTTGDWCPFSPVSFNDFFTGLSLTAGQNVVFQPQLQSGNSYYTAKLGDPYTNGTLTIQEIKQ